MSIQIVYRGGGCPYRIDRGVCNDVLCDVSIRGGR